jgi:hypothetical protein
MHKFWHFVFGIVTALIMISQSATAQGDSSNYFIPTRDPIMSTINGKVRFMVSEEVLVRAANLRFAKLGEIESIYKKEMEGDWYVYIECRLDGNIEESAIVSVKMRLDDKGNYFADNSWHACVGESCGSCGWDVMSNFCFCKTDKPGEPGTPGECYNIWSDDPLFFTTPLKPQ